MTPAEDVEKNCDEALLQRAKSLAVVLTSAFNKMAKSPPFNSQGHIALNQSLLVHACISYEIDMKRWLPFHKIKIPKNYKRAAFLFKWIARMHPVRTAAKAGDETPFEMAANSFLALLAALGELDVDMEKFGDSDEIKEFLYAATYRDIHPGNWAITFSLLEKSFPLK